MMAKWSLLAAAVLLPVSRLRAADASALLSGGDRKTERPWEMAATMMRMGPTHLHQPRRFLASRQRR